MSDYEFFNRMINRITKDYDYDIANRFQRLFIKKENENIELQEKIDKAIEYIKEHSEMTNIQIYGIENVLAFRGNTKELLDILGDKENE